MYKDIENIEKEIFGGRMFGEGLPEKYGFVRKGETYELEASFMGGDFTAQITVGQDGAVTGRVTDRMNDEEYSRLRNPLFTGAYVNSVRASYEELLRDIADKCCLPERDRRAEADDFARRVLMIADSIPVGKVATYGQLARLAGRERNARLVGRIMSMADRYGDHPCHRVVSSSGRTVPGWAEQRGMLEADGVTFRDNGCVDMDRHRWEK